MDLKLVETLVVREFSKTFDKLEFHVELNKEKTFVEFRFDALKLEGVNSQIFLALACASSGVAMLTAFISRLKKNLKTFSALNDFNYHTTALKAFLDPQGCLILENNFRIFSEQEFVDQAFDFISHIVKLQENQYLKRLLENRYEA